MKIQFDPTLHKVYYVYVSQIKSDERVSLSPSN